MSSSTHYFENLNKFKYIIMNELPFNHKADADHYFKSKDCAHVPYRLSTYTPTY
jgi:hypothetical protein